MKKDKTLKLALEALESADWYIDQLEMIVYSVDDDGTHENRAKVQAAITAIKEALAQPVQEPVAQWQKRHQLWTEDAWENSEEHDAKQWRDKAQGWEIRALYTAPQQRPWVGLTPQEIDDIDEANWEEDHKVWGIHEFAQAIETALRRKNT
jgi:hypothetical protein